MEADAPKGPVASSFAERMQALEERELSPLAARSYPSRRAREESDCSLRTPLQRDRDRIVHSKAFRRLKGKTQVFIAPEDDHHRTRLTHTVEVTQISRTVARALSLNEDLTEAIGLGHDLGHTPFGHLGESVLDECLTERYGTQFKHFEHSLRVVDVIERDYTGLNLTDDVRDGILCHSGRSPQPRTLEGAIVRVVDRVAYINHDIDDALRAGVLDEGQIPERPLEILGRTGSQRIDALVHDLVEHSAKAEAIVQGEEAAAAMDELRTFMFDEVYLGPQVLAEQERIVNVLRALFWHFAEHPDTIPDGGGAPGASEAQRVADYLAGMTDRFCLRAFQELSLPHSVPE